jgi:hypothetical protein
MRISTINAGEEHSQYFGQVYQEHYAGLRHYFLTHLGNASEADACVQETINYLFFFMEDRCWETDVENVPVYLMRIAGGLLCSKKLDGKTVYHKNSLGDNVPNGLFAKIRNEVIQPIKARIEFMWLFLRVGWQRQVAEDKP